MHGKFGGNTRGYYDNAYLSSLKRIGAVGTKLTTFKSILRNDFLNKTSILSRAAAILVALGPRLDAARAAHTVDQLIWTTMQTICETRHAEIVFDMSWTPEMWHDWVDQCPFDGARDKNDFFQDNKPSIFGWDDLDKLVALCPVASYKPLHGATDHREVLASGILSGKFRLSEKVGGHYTRRFQPLIRGQWDDAMEEYIKNSPANIPKPSYPTGPYTAITPQPTRRTAVEATWINKYLNRQAQFCSGDIMSQSALAVTYLDLMRHAIQAARYKELQTLDRLFEKWVSEGKFDIDTYNMTQVPLPGPGQVSEYRYRRPDLEKKNGSRQRTTPKGRRERGSPPETPTSRWTDRDGL
jgi:hypothetical protein